MRSLTTLLWAASLAAACSPGPDDLEPIEAPRLLLALLEQPDMRTVEQEHGTFGVRVDVLRPRKQKNEGGWLGALPAMEITPPGEVRFALPELPEGARLDFALAILGKTYRGRGEVHFELELDGRPAFARSLPSSHDVERRKRRWHPHQLPLAGARELVIRTRYTGDAAPSPRAAVAGLRVVEPRRIPRTRASRERPNVVLVVIDTLRADRLSCYGNPHPASPHLDALAARGTLFEAAFTPAPWTVPSTTSILTSLPLTEHGAGVKISNYLPEDLETLAEAFQEAGVTTAAFCSNPLVSAGRNFGQGFEAFHDYRWMRSQRIEEDVLAWIDAHHDRRFFLYLHPVDPHDPYNPPDEFRADVPPRPKGFEVQQHKPLMDHFRENGRFPEPFLEQLVQHDLPLYDGEVSGVDSVLGRVFARIEELGIADRTVIAVTSDHGEEFGEHGMIGHANQLFAESHHVPLVIAGPGVPRGERIAARVENRLVGPTLLALADIAPRGSIEPTNLLDPEQRAAHSRLPFHRSTGAGWVRRTDTGEWIEVDSQHALRDDRWLFLWARLREERHEDIYQLYDLASDPEAKVDVAAVHPDRVADFREQLVAVLAGSEERASFMEGAEDREDMEALGYVGED